MLETCLHGEHLRLHARMVEFAGYDMPLHYGSQIEEHHAVRRGCGLFDVSHMGVVDVQEIPAAVDALARLVANDPGKLKPGRALYSCLLNEQGGVIDDLIIYRLGDQRYRLVVNASGKLRDLEWMRAHVSGVDFVLRSDLAILALQGPASHDILAAVLDGAELARVRALPRFATTLVGETQWAATGYTGEKGFEIILPSSQAPSVWTRLLNAGAHPIGLGARDTLRLEAGMNLCGLDMDESVTPLECGLRWTVALKPAARQFIGRAALERQLEQGVPHRVIGVRLVDKGVLRPHQQVFDAEGEAGHLTSGVYSPTLGYSIGLARVRAAAHPPYSVDIRGRRLALEVQEPPFVQPGSAAVSDIQKT